VDNRERKQLRKGINRLIDRHRLDQKYIVLFGASIASKEVKTCLAERGIVPDAVIDNDDRRVGRECLGLIVQKPEAVLQPFKANAAILICSGGFYREMTFQLTKLGYKKNRHIFCLNFQNNESLPIFIFHLIRLFIGWLAYKKLVRKYSAEHTVFLAPYTGTGDIYLAGLFFQKYLKEHNISQYVFVVVSGACRKVAAMFGIKNIEVVPHLVTDDIINCNRALRADWPIVILNDSWAADYTNLLQWLRGYKGLSFDKMFRYFVFGFDDTAAYQLPLPAPCTAEVEALFKKHGLIKGRTVVLSPYSNTLFELPDEVWKRIADHCRERGYTVCTNCAGAGSGEPPVRGTAAVFFPLGQAIEFLNTAGYFVGVRSGLCDIISSSTCKKVILYEKDGFFYKCSPFDYFSLKKMGLCADALELEYRSDWKEQVLDKILGLLA